MNDDMDLYVNKLTPGKRCLMSVFKLLAGEGADAVLALKGFANQSVYVQHALLIIHHHFDRKIVVGDKTFGLNSFNYF